MQPVRTVTLLDLRLGLVHLTDEQTETIRQKVVPILARVAQRLIREGRAAKRASSSVATGALAP